MTPAEAEGPAASLALPLTRPSASDLGSLGRSGFDLDIRRPAAPPPTEPLPEQPRESEEAIVDDLKRETALRLNTEAQVDLAAAARLCGDLARVKDAGQLPALLARAAELLDASGIVLWLAGAEGTVIRPAASVGYSDHTLSRMKTLSGRSDNAVSVAFREGRMEVVAGAKDRNGAVVVPIVTDEQAGPARWPPRSATAPNPARRSRPSSRSSRPSWPRSSRTRRGRNGQAQAFGLDLPLSAVPIPGSVTLRPQAERRKPQAASRAATRAPPPLRCPWPDRHCARSGARPRTGRGGGSANVAERYQACFQKLRPGTAS